MVDQTLSSEDRVIEETRCWIERIVIGNNFCPFARKPFFNDTVRYSAAMAETPEGVVERLVEELLLLRDADRAAVETTLLIIPNCFRDFDEYNQFLDVVDAVIGEHELRGIVQVASFHPEYRFADLSPDDVRNYTNRSPYPMFHLILEDSVEAARAAHSDVEGIPGANMERLEAMGVEEAMRQLRGCRRADLD